MAKQKVQTERDVLRSLTIGATTRRWKSISLPLGDDGDEKTFVIVAPSLAQQEAAQQACGLKFTPTADGSKATAVFDNPLRYRVEMVIACAHEPHFGPNGEITGYGEPVYGQLDKPVLMSFEDIGWFKQLADEVTTFAQKAPEVAAKNLKATSNAASASA